MKTDKLRTLLQYVEALTKNGRDPTVSDLTEIWNVLSCIIMEIEADQPIVSKEDCIQHFTGTDISEILDKHLPADGCGTEREKIRMRLHHDITRLVLSKEEKGGEK